MAKMGLEVRFRNKVQVALYECELKGQISDGNWENSVPWNHWEDPCNATAVVGKPGERLGPVNFCPRRNYGFGSRFLLNCVGDRMLLYARVVQAFPQMMSHLDEHWNWEKSEKFFTLEEQAKINAVPYSIKDLRFDLDDMSRIWAGRLSKEEEKASKARVKAAQLIADKEFEAHQRAELYNGQSEQVKVLRQQLAEEETKLDNIVKDMVEKDARPG